MRFLAFFLAAFFCGCALPEFKSRYAMDDPVYAEKYEEGAERGDLLGKVKQAADARHTKGLFGLYVSGGATGQPDTSNLLLGGELGAEYYPQSWITVRGAWANYLGEDGGFTGLDAGVRLQSPTRFAPFVGAGTFLGYSQAEDDGMIDGWEGAIYPELGAHYWIDGNWRLTTHGRYMITTEGRRQDDWLLGLQLAFFKR